MSSLHKTKSVESQNIKKMTPKDILEMIKTYLPVRENEKNQFGEVFTPVELIDDMLNALPPKVWKNPNLKWLDPANGIGNFPLVVYQRLLKGLRQVIPDENERKKHIINNMLYMVELNPKNILISKKIFGRNANIACGSFLENEWKQKFKMDKFDIIIGNPPYNSPNTLASGNTIWAAFVKQALTCLKKNGYLVFVHPPSWRKPESKKSKSAGMFKMMAHENHILHLEIYNTSHGMNTFGCGTRYDWYVLHKIKPELALTRVKDEKGLFHELDLREWDFLPNYNFNTIKKLISKTKTHLEVIYSSQYDPRKEWVNPLKTKEFKYPLVHTTPKDGVRYNWTSTKTPNVKEMVPMFGVSKVIFGDSGIYDVIIDIDGQYGMTQHAIGLKVADINEATLLKTALESAKFNDVIDALSFSSFQIDWVIFTYFKKDFYKYFLSKNTSS